MALEVAQLLATLKGDTSGFTASMKQANADAADFEEKAKGHFSGVTGALKGLVGAVGAIGFAEMAKSAVESADTQETAWTSLKTTMANYGLGNKQAEDSVDSFIKKQAAANGFMQSDVTNAYNQVILATKNTADANSDLGLAEDIARAKHIDLATAAGLVAKAADGNTGALARQFPFVSQLTAAHASAKTILDAVSASVKGQASAFDDTSAGASARFKSSINELEISVGEKLIPAFVKLVGVGQDIIAFFSQHPAVTKFVEVVAALGAAVVIVNKAQEAWKATTEAFSAVQAIFNAVLAANPIVLVVAAIALLAAGLYEAYQHVQWFHDIVADVFGWIGGFVSGAISVVQGAVSGVWNWVRNNWPLLLGILTGPIGLAVVEIVKHWDDIKNGFTAVKNWIGDRVDDVVDFFVRMPGRITAAVAHAFDGLVNAFKNAAGDMIKAIPGGGIVSDVLGHLPHFAAGGPISGLSVVGENGPELFMPSLPGTIIPNSMFSSGGGGGSSFAGGGGGDTYHVTVNVQGSVTTDADLADKLHKALLSKQRRTGNLGFEAA